jgi:hypothetical protein
MKIKQYNAAKSKNYSDKIGSNDIVRRIMWLTNRYEMYEKYWRSDLDRCARNARMYWCVDYGMWPEEAIAELISQWRKPMTIPIIPDKIETLLGSILANGLDIKYEPIPCEVDTLVEIVQDMYYADKNTYNWDMSEIPALLDAMIMVGYERMIIKENSAWNDPFGGIGFENIHPAHTLISPAWKSNDINDIRDYFTFDLKTADEIKRLYPNSSQQIDDLYDREGTDGIDYGINYGAAPRWRTVEEKWGSRHKILEYHYIEDVSDKWEYDRKHFCWFPETGSKFGSPQDIESKKQYAIKNNLGTDEIVMLKRQHKIKYIQAICPELDQNLLLIDGQDLIQTNNCNVYPISAIRYKGQCQGLVDRLYDMQFAINKSETNILDQQARAIRSVFIDEAVVDGDPAKKIEFENTWSKSGGIMWGSEGITERVPNPVITFPNMRPTADDFTNLNRMYDNTDRFSKVPAAQDARSESGQESGRLFRYKIEVGLVQQKLFGKQIEEHKKQKAVAYIKQAKITHSANPREFFTINAKKVSINTKAVDITTGRDVILNDISTLPEMKVLVYTSKSGLSARIDTRNEALDYVQALQSDPNNRPITLEWLKKAMMTTEMQPEEKEQMEMMFDLMLKDATLGVALSISQKQAAIKQIAMQTQQMDQQASMGGMPPEEQEQPVKQNVNREPPPPEEQEQLAMAGTMQEV